MPAHYTSRFDATVRETVGDWTFNRENHVFDAELGIEQYEYHSAETRPLTIYVLTVGKDVNDNWEIAMVTQSRYGTTHNLLETAATREAALGLAYAYMDNKRTSAHLPP